MMKDQESEEKSATKCFRCGKELPPGSLSYVVNIEVFAGFNGYLIEPEEGVDGQLKRLFEQVKDSDPEELEKEVYEEFTLVLCKSCRDRFVEEIKHPWEGPFKIRTRPDDILH